MTDNDSTRLSKRLKTEAGPKTPSTNTRSTETTTCLNPSAIKVDSDHVKYDSNYIRTQYQYSYSSVSWNEQNPNQEVSIKPMVEDYEFVTQRVPRKLGLMQVGLGGNNATTVVAAILANQKNISWETRTGVQHPNYYGCLTQAATLRLGFDENKRDIFAPLHSVIPMVKANDIVMSGWDISSLNMYEAMKRAQVLDPDLINKLKPNTEKMVPLKAAFDRSFIAENQSARADNLLDYTKIGKKGMLEQLRKDIREFKEKNKLTYVVVVWTANSERYSRVIEGVNDTASALLTSINANHAEVSPSTLYAVAAILEGCAFINGSPQNTFVPGCVQLAEEHQVCICGDDFKSGQTKMKSVLVDYLVGCGLKVKTMVTYNHLGNNDMYQLTDGEMWKPKSASKSRVIEDIVQSNAVLYKHGEMPDHVVVVKYVEYLGDSKRDVSEYTTEGFMNAHYTTIIHNTCLDSILCAPLIIDLAIFAELFDRVRFRKLGSTQSESSKGEVPFDKMSRMHPILSVLGFFMKLPLTPPDEPIVNSLNRQKGCIENMVRALVGLPPENHLLLNTKLI